MAPFELGAWVLGNFANVDELKTALADSEGVVVDTPAPGFGSSPRIISCATKAASRSSSSRSAAC
jgi:penicillin V acylase-like amidase (Ntn superfamily)